MQSVLIPPKSVEDVFQRLDENYESYGKGARQIVQFLRLKPADIAALQAGELGKICGVHASSVVRLAQSIGFSGYREMQALFKQSYSAADIQLVDRRDNTRATTLRVRLIAESGRSFNAELKVAVERYARQNPSVQILGTFHLPHMIDGETLAGEVSEASHDCDALILVARDEAPVSRVVKSVVETGVPVVCLTSDLTSSSRTAYVGLDQYAAGKTAAWLCGRANHRAGDRVLLVYSVPFRCQLERESGFRHTLRSLFPDLVIDEKVSSDEDVDVTYEAVRRYIASSGPPAAIYNVSGGNLGVGRALSEAGFAGETVFVGHELNPNSRSLLEAGVMDFTIGHDFDREIDLAIGALRATIAGATVGNTTTECQIYTRFNCPT
jgi:LacI family transcriptional regulator